MPSLVAVADHGAVGAHHVADESIVNDPAGSLDAGAHESVRSAAHPKILLFCQGNQLAGLFHIHSQRLFGIHMFAVKQNLLGHFIVLVGTGQVEDDLHFRIVKGFVHIFINFRFPDSGACLDLFLHISHAFFGPLRDQIAHADQIQFPENLGNILQIDAADGAHADHCDSYLFHRLLLRFRHL